MSSRNRIFILIIAIALSVVSISAYLFLRQPITPSSSFLLYTNYQSPETITNWIVDTDTGKKWEVGKGLATGGWSPLGNHLFYYTLLPLPTEIWVSDSDGGNLHQVFDSRNYPDLEIKDLDWLSDKTIIVNVFDIKDNHAYVYLLDISALTFEMQNPGRFMRVSPNGQFWVQWTGQDEYHLTDLDKNLTRLSILASDFYFFSPDGNQWAYFCDRQESSSSVCIADVGINGVTNEHKIADVETPVRTLDMWWSQDGKYIGIQTYNRSTNETRFRAIDISDGSIVYDWTFPTITTRNFWSPHNDKIIDFDGLLLNLKTGEVRNFFQDINETVPSYIVDWRMIEVP